MYSYSIRIVDADKLPTQMWEIHGESILEPTKEFLLGCIKEKEKAYKLIKDIWLYVKFKEIKVGETIFKMARFPSEELALSFMIYHKI